MTGGQGGGLNEATQIGAWMWNPESRSSSSSRPTSVADETASQASAPMALLTTGSIPAGAGGDGQTQSFLDVVNNETTTIGHDSVDAGICNRGGPSLGSDGPETIINQCPNVCHAYVMHGSCSGCTRRHPTLLPEQMLLLRNALFQRRDQNTLRQKAHREATRSTTTTPSAGP